MAKTPRESSPSDSQRHFCCLPLVWCHRASRSPNGRSLDEADFGSLSAALQEQHPDDTGMMQEPKVSSIKLLLQGGPMFSRLSLIVRYRPTFGLFFYFRVLKTLLRVFIYQLFGPYSSLYLSEGDCVFKVVCRSAVCAVRAPLVKSSLMLSPL